MKMEPLTVKLESAEFVAQVKQVTVLLQEITNAQREATAALESSIRLATEEQIRTLQELEEQIRTLQELIAEAKKLRRS